MLVVIATANLIWGLHFVMQETEQHPETDPFSDRLAGYRLACEAQRQVVQRESAKLDELEATLAAFERVAAELSAPPPSLPGLRSRRSPGGESAASLVRRFAERATEPFTIDDLDKYVKDNGVNASRNAIQTAVSRQYRDGELEQVEPSSGKKPARYVKKIPGNGQSSAVPINTLISD